MAAGIMSEGILIIASVIIATVIAGIVMSQMGVFESTFTATTEGQKDILLTKIKIVYATNTTDNTVNIWMKNVGINPVMDLDKVDVYFGEIGQTKRVGYDPGDPDTDDTWEYETDPTIPSIWQIMDTIGINITDNNLQKDVTYLVSVTAPNGVTDEHIFSLPT